MSDMPRDWTGTLEGVFRQLGASNHSQAEREENDYYATDPKAIDLLLTRESPSRRVWEPSSGGGSSIEPSAGTRLRCGVERPLGPRGAGLHGGLPALHGALRRGYRHEPALPLGGRVRPESDRAGERKGVHVPQADVPRGAGPLRSPLQPVPAEKGICVPEAHRLREERRIPQIQRRRLRVVRLGEGI